MGRIPREIVDAVRDRTDIAAVIGRRVKLQKAGNSLKGLCPFHDEKTPSFHVIPSKGIFHCFGCQESGDVFGFLMKIEGLSFVEAVTELAGPAGVELSIEELTAEQRRQLRARSSLFDVLEAAASYYESLLWTRPEGQDARDYLRRRGLPEAVLREARLGYAPRAWDGLLNHLHRRGFPASMVMEAGLVRQRKERDGHYDFFRNRIMFPIRDDRGRVIGFGGRVLPGDDAPKYFNNVQTPLYDKSTVLYGIETARSAIQRADRTIVVEGYFDVLAMRAAGYPETVACCGTALTPQHLARLSRLSRNLLLLTDGDRAGQEAAERALPLLVKAGIHAFRVDLPGAKDPDELFASQGPEAIAAALERRQSLVEWVVDRKLEQYGDPTSVGVEHTAMARERVLEELREIFELLPHSLVSRIASQIGMREEIVLDRLRRAPPTPPSGSPPPASGWRPVRDMVHIFWLLIHRYDQVADLVQGVPLDVFADHPATHASLARLLSGEPVANILDEEPDPGVARTLAAAVAREVLYTEEQAALAAAQVIRRLLEPRLQARRTRLNNALEAALRDGDEEARATIIRQRAELLAQTRALDEALARGDLIRFMEQVQAS